MPQRQLSVIVVGGGIGGLSAAIALRQAGHFVKVSETGRCRLLFLGRFIKPNYNQVFERSSGEEVGAGIVLGSCAGRILDSWGFDHQRAHQVDSTGRQFVAADTLEPIAPFIDFSHLSKAYGVPQRQVHRVDLHKELCRLASRTDGRGQPARVLTNSPVASFDAAAGAVTLGDGSTHKADLVVTADGVHSSAARLVNGASCPPVRATATTVIRFVIPTAALKDDAANAAILPADPGVTTVYVARGESRYLVRYACRSATLQNFGLYSVENEELADAQQLRFSTERSTLRRELDGFHPSCVKLADLTSDILPLWRCSSRDALELWSTGRLVILGDAAHPLLPNLGLGAVSAIEDAAALGVVLGEVGRDEEPQGDLDAWLEARLRMYETVRKNRTAVYKLYSDIPMFRDCITEQKAKCLEFLKEEELPEAKLHIAERKNWQDWLWGYDVKAQAEKMLGAAAS